MVERGHEREYSEFEYSEFEYSERKYSGGLMPAS
jgi:hypothetical protein